MILCFVLDTSLAMNQVTKEGVSYLDAAKNAVSYFLKRRMGYGIDRYLLVTFSDNEEDGVVIDWEDRCDGTNVSKFEESLRCIKADDFTGSIGRALSKAFELMNRPRMENNVDSYSYGRRPWALKNSLQPATLIFLTPGRLHCDSEIEQKISEYFVLDERSPPEKKQLMDPHDEYCSERVRWDHKFICIKLTIPSAIGVEGNSKGPSGSDPLNKLAFKTGGLIYECNSSKTLYKCMDEILMRVPVVSVLCHFNRLALPCSSTASKLSEVTIAATVKACIIIKENNVIPVGRTSVNGGLWPIPEAYYPTRKLDSIPVRQPYPEICVDPSSVAPSFDALIERFNFPVDTYDIEGGDGTLGDRILEPGEQIRWNCFILNSWDSLTKYDSPLPFGYVKIEGQPRGFLSTSSGNKVTLHVLPFNYPHILHLFGELVASIPNYQRDITNLGMFSLPKDWRLKFERYLDSVPSYYFPSLKIVMEGYNLHNLVVTPQELFNTKSKGFRFDINLKLIRLSKEIKLSNEKRMAQRELKDKGKITTPKFAGESNLSTVFASISPSSSSAPPVRATLDESLEEVAEMNSLLRTTYGDDDESEKKKNTDRFFLSSLSSQKRHYAFHSVGVVHSFPLVSKVLDEIDGSVSKWALRERRKYTSGVSGSSLIADTLMLNRVFSPSTDLVEKENSLHAVQISTMGDYNSHFNRKGLRNPYCDEKEEKEEKQRKRETHFGNPYKSPKAPKRLVTGLSVDEAEIVVTNEKVKGKGGKEKGKEEPTGETALFSQDMEESNPLYLAESNTHAWQALKSLTRERKINETEIVKTLSLIQGGSPVKILYAEAVLSLLSDMMVKETGFLTDFIEFEKGGEN